MRHFDNRLVDLEVLATLRLDEVLRGLDLWRCHQRIVHRVRRLAHHLPVEVLLFTCWPERFLVLLQPVDLLNYRGPFSLLAHEPLLRRVCVLVVTALRSQVQLALYHALLMLGHGGALVTLDNVLVNFRTLVDL